MGIPVKLGIGAALVAIGLAGLVYTMPLVSNAVASEELVYKEEDVPAYPRWLVPFTALEVASAAVLTGGIALCAVGYGEALTGPALPSRANAKDMTDSSNKEKTEDASGA